MAEPIQGVVVRNRQGKTIAGLTPDNPRMSRFQQRVYDLYMVEGMTQAEIARETGKSQGYISNVLSAVRKLIPPPTREDMIAAQRAKLDALYAVWMPRALAGNFTAMKAVDRIMQREARLFGLDAPTHVKLSPGETVTYVIEDPDLESMK